MKQDLKIILVIITSYSLGWASNHYLNKSSILEQQSDTEPTSTAIHFNEIPLNETSQSNNNTTNKDIQYYLTTNQFDKAVELYDLAYKSFDAKKSDIVKRLILNHAYRLLQKNDLTKSHALLIKFLNSAYRDPEALNLLADVLHAQENYFSEIKILVSLKGIVFQNEAIRILNSRLSDLIDNYSQRLHQHQKPNLVKDLYQYLINLFPDNLDYQYAYGKIVYELAYYDKAIAPLTMATQNTELKPQAMELLNKVNNKITLSQQYESTIPLKPKGMSYQVDAVININISATLLLDTGASMTTITPAIANQLQHSNYKTLNKQFFYTANGAVND